MKSTTVQQWTKEIPTEDGWYWIRLNKNKWLDFLAGGKVLTINDSDEYELKSFNKDISWEFYGPLEEPE